MVLKNVENKIKLVTIVCSIFLAGCIVISLGAVFTARQMVNDAHKQIYVFTCFSPLPLMTSISAIPLTRPCTLSMRRDLPSTMP